MSPIYATLCADLMSPIYATLCADLIVPYVLHYVLISSKYFVKSTNYEAHIRISKYQNIWAFF